MIKSISSPKFLFYVQKFFSDFVRMHVVFM